MARFLLLALLIVSCKEQVPDAAALDIDKAIELIHANKAINDTLQRYRQQYGVDFIFCYIITTENHRNLGMQVMQSAHENGPPLNINKPYRIEKVQGIDLLFVSSEWDRDKDYDLNIDDKAKELIKKGYLTVSERSWTYCTSSIDLIYCKNDDNVFTILSPDFKWKEEVKARNARKPYDEREFYPECGELPEQPKKASPWWSSKSK